MTTGSSVRVFGGVAVDGVDGPVSIGGPRQRRLLALLVVRPELIATNDWLAEHLWSDDERPETTARAIRTYMSRLRQSLPPDAQGWIDTESSGYRWAGPIDALEHRRFGQLRAAATQARSAGDPQTATVLLDDALALWRGEPFRELEDLDWATAVIEQLRIDRLEMQEERWEAALGLGRHTQIVGELAAFTAEHRLRDRAARQYALALYRSGRTAEALRVIGAHREALVDQSGLDPSPGIVELESALLAGDPSLDLDTSGRPLRGYRLLDEAGSGAFSIVWRATQPSVDRDVAIKQIRAELAAQPDFIRRFEAEAHLVARIEHPHIVPLIDYWRDPDSAYLVMRWLRGGTLERRLDGGPLTVPQTLELAREVGGALSAAHAAGVVHRDVKTSNILFDEHEHAFLTDFGIALEVADSSGPEAALSTGSPAYASPEQLRREPLNGAADIFSLGVVLFECLAGELPFPKVTDVAELVELQLHSEYPLLTSLRADVPDGVTRAIARATAKEPGERFATIEEFVAALGVSASDTGPAARITTHADVTNPYLGLRAFDAGDADRFFGRERLVGEMLDRLSGTGAPSRCLLVVGPSGSGKSSVVRAGLLPAVRAGAIDGSDDWFVTTMTPGRDPFESLEAALRRVAVNPPPSLIEQLRSGSSGIVRGVRRCLPTDDDRLLLVIDQFEEMFVGASADLADEFLTALTMAIDDPTSPLTVVATLRADYYDRPLDHPSFATIAADGTLQVTRLSADELERAIIEPAAALGVEFEAGLVARMVAETVGQPSSLPLVQFTLSELFDRRTDDRITGAAYDELGGIGGALAARGEGIFLAADEPQRRTIRRIFGDLVDPAEQTADLRRRVARADLGDEPEVAWALGRLGEARLLTFDRDATTREPTVEVAHEALLREWPRLTDWLADDIEMLRAVDRVRAAAGAWDEVGRTDTDLYRGDRLAQAEELALASPNRLRPLDHDFITASRDASDATRRREEQRVRRLRRLVAGTAVAMVLALVAGGLALRSQQRADDAASTAEAERAVAEAERAAALDATERAETATIISRSAALVDEEPDAAVLLALEAHRRGPGPATEQAILNALGSVPTPNRVASGPAEFGARDCPPTPSPGALLDLGVIDGELAVRDNLTGTITREGPAPADCVFWITDAEFERRLAITPAGDRVWTSAGADAAFVEIDIDALVAPDGSFTDDGRVVASTDEGAAVFDGLTGQVVGEVIVDGGVRSAVPAVAGTRAALAFEVRLGGEVSGVILIIDTETAEVLHRIETPLPAARLVWDAQTDEVIGALVDGPILTLDAETGALLHTIETNETGLGLVDLGIRSDGLLVAISRAQAQLIDRRTGPVGAPVPLDDVLDARVRADGLIQVVTPDLRVDVIDLDGNALVRRTLPTDPFSATTIVGDRAGVVTVATRDAEIIDLASGERRQVELSTGDGEPFLASLVIPADEGVWAASRDGVVGRWVDGEAVESIDLGGVVLAGGNDRDHMALVIESADGAVTAHLVDLVPGGLQSGLTIDAPEASAIRPATGGGLYILTEDGVLSRHDDDGDLVDRFDTDVRDAAVVAPDRGSDRVAIAHAAGVAIVDIATGEVEELPVATDAASVAFVRSGSLLTVMSADGSVRLWDLERGASAGLAWNGDGSSPLGSDLQFDPSADTVWLPVSGRLIEVPLTADLWIERACALVGRDLTESEWERHVPGGGPVQSACT